LSPELGVRRVCTIHHCFDIQLRSNWSNFRVTPHHLAAFPSKVSFTFRKSKLSWCEMMVYSVKELCRVREICHCSQLLFDEIVYKSSQWIFEPFHLFFCIHAEIHLYRLQDKLMKKKCDYLSAVDASSFIFRSYFRSETKYSSTALWYFFSFLF